MNLKVFIASLVLAILLATACLAAILIYFNPFASNCLIFILFYLSLFIALAGILTLINLFIRRISRRISLSKSQAVRQLETAFRQGVLLAIILVAVLVLQSQRILAWWYLLVLVGLVGLAEWRLARK